MLLKDIIVNTKTVEVEFPGLDGFKISIAAISREVSRKLASAAIKGWSGLKMKYLSELLLVDASKIEDLESEVDFSLENVVELLKHSQIFDTWINEQVFNIERFRD